MKRSGKTILIAGSAIVGAVILLTAFYFVYCKAMIYSDCRVEAGVNVTCDSLLRSPAADACFEDGSRDFDTSVPGVYELTVKKGIFKGKCRLTVEDTLAPMVILKDVDMHLGDSCGPDAFVVSISDASECSVYFENEPDFLLPGNQDLNIAVRDSSGNICRGTVTLFITAVSEEIDVEAGTVLPRASEIAFASKKAAYVTDARTIDLSRPGSRIVTINADGRDYRVKFNITDTEAPELVLRSSEVYAGVRLEASDFVERCRDVSEVSFEFGGEPDFVTPGEKEVTVIARDAFGNCSIGSTLLTVLEDSEPPVFEGIGVMYGYIGENFLYRTGVSVTDNSGVPIEFTVDSSAVAEDVTGEYPITFTAVDFAGNVTEVSSFFRVVERKYSQEQIDEAIEKAYNSIIDDGMDEIEKIYAIWKYTKAHVHYENGWQHTDPDRAAYEGITLGYGDCFTFAAVAKALYTRAGIENVIAQRQSGVGRNTHFWNMINIGDGWYFVDSCPRQDKPKIFLWNGELMQMYSEAHGKTHLYDTNLYPEANMYGDIYTWYYGEGHSHPKFTVGTVLDELWAAEGIYTEGYKVP